MDGRDENDWYMEDSNDQPFSPVEEKRKYRTKKIEFIGWGSRQLIEFLTSLGKDTSQQISQHEMTSIITEYAHNNSLYHPQKKKRIVCDEKLHSLFGKKMVPRIKIYDLLEPHYAENEEDWDNFFSSSDENGEGSSVGHKSSSKNPLKRRCIETPKSCFASIVPANIKPVYLKKTLIVELLENPETFEGKLIGSFIRVKKDPNDIFSKFTHQLQQVIGVKMGSGSGDAVTETLLEVPTFYKEVRLSMLSGDNFSEEECKDLQERVENGSTKKPTVVELQEKVHQLHEDITKHWIKRELTTLKHLIDRANEKGWRKELFEHLERRDLLVKESEQTRLLTEIPVIIADELKLGETPQEENNAIPPCLLASDKLIPNLEVNQAVFNHEDVVGQNNKENHAIQRRDNEVLHSHAETSEAAHFDEEIVDEEIVIFGSGQNNKEKHAIQRRDNEVLHSHVDTSEAAHFDEEIVVVQCSAKSPQNSESVEIVAENQTISRSSNEENEVAVVKTEQVNSRATTNVTSVSRGPTIELVELSDDDDDDDDDDIVEIGVVQTKVGIPETPELEGWHYSDPQGVVQGPFPLLSLKRWHDCNYFPSNFKIWKAGQNRNEAVLLVNLLGKHPDLF